MKDLERELKDTKNKTLLNSLFIRKVEIRQNYILSLDEANPKKFRRTFKEVNPYFMKRGKKTFVAAILGFDWLVKMVMRKKRNLVR